MHDHQVQNILQCKYTAPCNFTAQTTEISTFGNMLCEAALSNITAVIKVSVRDLCLLTLCNDTDHICIKLQRGFSLLMILFSALLIFYY